MQGLYICSQDFGKRHRNEVSPDNGEAPVEAKRKENTRVGRPQRLKQVRSSGCESFYSRKRQRGKSKSGG
ncbi:hypothetical protein B0H10DRAFT_553562 [Mycena sp. CBHHK59/15]|nr:hypothetical protein B0H10DRAFT_553562 [Mycena sp. CBHHK59/15]